MIANNISLYEGSQLMSNMSNTVNVFVYVRLYTGSFG
jgi:hypothetical protein